MERRGARGESVTGSKLKATKSNKGSERPVSSLKESESSVMHGNTVCVDLTLGGKQGRNASFTEFTEQNQGFNVLKQSGLYDPPHLKAKGFIPVRTALDRAHTLG